MPKRRAEFKDIGQAERERAIIEIVQRNGMASVDDVVEALASRFELTLSDLLAKAALKKSVRIYLQKSAERRDIFGRAYFKKGSDNPEKVPDEDLERDEEGKVRNKYSVKYFLLGSDDHLPGGNLISEIGGLFLSHTDSNGSFSIEWQISRFLESKSKHFYFVFVGKHGRYISLTAPLADAPFTLIVGRLKQGHKYAPETSELAGDFKRPSLLLLDDISMSAPKRDEKPGHGILHINADGSAFIEDLNSTNGTFYIEAKPTDSTKINKLSQDADLAITAKRADSVIDSYKGSWIKVSDKIKLKLPAFIRFGTFQAFILVT